jgi:hypothetical protein
MQRRPRWVLTISVAVIAIGVAVWSTYFNGPSEKCKPVVDMLDFNHQQSALIDAKGGTGTPTVAEDPLYQQWADGLAVRAQKVNDPALAAQATQLAQLANEFVAGLPRVRAAKDAQAPGAPAPPVVYEMSALSDRITEQIGQLSQACS